jgi:hypothetical protein
MSPPAEMSWDSTRDETEAYKRSPRKIKVTDFPDEMGTGIFFRTRGGKYTRPHVVQDRPRGPGEVKTLVVDPAVLR